MVLNAHHRDCIVRPVSHHLTLSVDRHSIFESNAKTATQGRQSELTQPHVNMAKGMYAICLVMKYWVIIFVNTT